MLAELRTKSQITIPKEIVTTLGLSEGDKLEVCEKDGMICLMPVVVYPRKYVENLRNEITELKAQAKGGDRPVYESVDALFDSLENE